METTYKLDDLLKVLKTSSASLNLYMCRAEFANVRKGHTTYVVTPEQLDRLKLLTSGRRGPRTKTKKKRA